MRRALYLLKVYLWTVVVFIIAKVAFMYYNQEGHDYSWNDLWDVVRHGLSLDLSTALYFIIFPFLVVLVSLWWNNEKVLRRVLSVYYVVISIAFALAFVADSSLYPFWGFKLDASCLQYLETPTEAMASVSTGYLIMRLLVIGIVAVLIYMGYHAPSTNIAQRSTLNPPRFRRSLCLAQRKGGLLCGTSASVTAWPTVCLSCCDRRQMLSLLHLPCASSRA